MVVYAWNHILNRAGTYKLSYSYIQSVPRAPYLLHMGYTYVRIQSEKQEKQRLFLEK